MGTKFQEYLSYKFGTVLKNSNLWVLPTTDFTGFFGFSDELKFYEIIN